MQAQTAHQIEHEIKALRLRIRRLQLEQRVAALAEAERAALGERDLRSGADQRAASRASAT